MEPKTESRQWFIFERRRGVFWRPQQAGYTTNPWEAGRYSDAEGLAIVERMNWTPEGDSQVVALPVNEHWLGARGAAKTHGGG